MTWLFGPIATLNVALTLSPFLSALAMYVLLRRWVSWAPAAFVGGLLYGFSPFVIVSLTDAHLMLGMAAVPPLIVLCLDELFVRQRWRPWVTGLAIGVLALVQLSVGTEVLVIAVIAAAVGTVLVVAGCSPRRARRPRPYALRGGAWAAMVARRCCWPTRPGSPWPVPPISPVTSGAAAWHLSYGGNTLGLFVHPMAPVARPPR